jgi:hypothetical protein
MVSTPNHFPKGGETFPPFALRVRDPAYRQAGALGRRPKGNEGGLDNVFQRAKLLQKNKFGYWLLIFWLLFGYWPACAKPRPAGRRQVLGFWLLHDLITHHDSPFTI